MASEQGAGGCEAGEEAVHERLLELLFTAADLPKLRTGIGECAALAGLCDTRRADFVLAVHEVACNAVEHGGGGGRLLLSSHDGTLHCRITDNGPGFSADLIPPQPPGIESGEGGRGLWLTRELTDRLEIAAAGAVGAVVTLVVVLS
ncbi:ATP-binding protein [Streptomyces sp. H27-D2]|uniref:ATP-binding protein n=1 Tax=Streptomyces sp. H27-D2 TaxID=3046304 RepID=UPI002DB7AD87|nr:ATP-binding protein [Streptomyces sp. H27-D2]MEC4019779.1 ATP-binding protein [Streptomyces sp. H27-D2]